MSRTRPFSSIERCKGVPNIAPRRKKCSQLVEHRPLDVARRNALAFGMRRTAASDERRRNIKQYRFPFFTAWVGERRAPSPSPLKMRPDNRLGASASTAKECSFLLAASLSYTICQSSGATIARAEGQMSCLSIVVKKLPDRLLARSLLGGRDRQSSRVNRG